MSSTTSTVRSNRRRGLDSSMVEEDPTSGAAPRGRRRRNNPEESSDLPSRVGRSAAPRSELDARSGLQTSDVDPGSPLSYSDASAISGAQGPMSSIRPGVNEDTALRTMFSTAGANENTDPSDAYAVVYGTDVNIAKVIERFKRFVTTFVLEDISNEPMLTTGQQLDATRPLYLQKIEDIYHSGELSLDVDLIHVQKFRNDLYEQIITFPKEVIPACDAAVNSIFVEKFHDRTLERSLQIRPFNCGRSRMLRCLDPDDLDQLVTVKGLVIRMSNIIPEMMKAEFRCSVCNATTSSVCERGNIPEPESCPRCKSRHSCQIIHNRCLFVDKQLIKLQECPEDMPSSQTPHTVSLYAHEDLVDLVQPGDRVVITGIYRAIPLRTNTKMTTLKAVYRTYVDVLHYKLEKSDRDDALATTNEEEGGESKPEDRYFTPEKVALIKELAAKPDLYERLTAAIAPSIYENEDIKKGILLQLFGGSRKDFTDKGRGHFRSEVNMLLCGDPGTSKSQLLQYVFKVAPRSQYTSGKGSSAVGLTAYVTKDPETGQISLQTGALALADNGICCIDEFDKMTDSTRSILHEVMEQQTLSIAKAGILCQLNARTSILAAANPVSSKWDPKKTIIDNIQLPHTLISRFDLIFLILDPHDEIYDARLARHLVSLYYKENADAAKSENGATNSVVANEVNSIPVTSILRDYITYAKANYCPTLSEEAGQYLIKEYVEMRQQGASRGNISAYPRQLESLIRLSEAHAKMRLARIVTEDDCKEARRLQKEALKQSSIDPRTGLIDVGILATGISMSIRERREEMASAIWNVLEERTKTITFSYQRVLESLRSQSDRMITREHFNDGLITLRNANKIDWAGTTIRKR